MNRILAIDDDEIFLKTLKNLLEYKYYKVLTCSNPLQAEKIVKEQNIDCVLLDVKMPGLDGLEVLESIHRNRPDIPIVMVSGQSTISVAVEAMKQGAYDFVEKPVDGDRLLIILKNAIDKKNLSKEKENLLKALKQKYSIVAASDSMNKILQQIETVAPTNTKIFITGETGTGKELIARAVHLSSNRASGPFIKINCAAIPTELLESELFGHKRGAFTGAFKDAPGKFQMADGGSLFLDEIGDMDLVLQAKLLHVLQDNEFMMLGSNDSIKVDVRIIAATNQNINALINSGKFRQDLFHRINVVNIHLPPLRERPEDIAPLARYFLLDFTDSYNKRINGFTPEAENILINYQWPGNVRELRNVIEKLVIFTKEQKIHSTDVLNILEVSPDIKKRQRQYGSFKDDLVRYEREYILRVLNFTGWKMQESAQRLGMDRSTLYKKMRKLKIKK